MYADRPLAQLGVVAVCMFTCLADGVVDSEEVCACAGHCYTSGHRYRSRLQLNPVCECKSLVAGSRYCPECCCEVLGCSCPRLRGTLCYLHRRVVQQCSVALQLVRNSRRAVLHMIPMDVQQMIVRYPVLRGHFLLVLTLAMLKDPAAIDAWLATDFPADFQAASLGDSAGECFGRSIISALRSLGDGEKDSESRELYRGGAAWRFLWKLWRGGACDRVALGHLARWEVSQGWWWGDGRLQDIMI